MNKLTQKLPILKKYQIRLDENPHNGYFKIHRYEVNYKKFDGNLSGNHIREVLLTRNSVGALLFDPNKKQIALIQQFRISPAAHQILNQPEKEENPWQLEIVAGTIAKGEDVEKTLVREVKEESGLDAINYEFVGSYYLCPGYSTEKMHTYCVEVDFNHYQQYAGLENEDEDIEIILFDYDEIPELTKKVTIFPTLCMLQWFVLNKINS